MPQSTRAAHSRKDTRPETVRAILDQRNHYRRALQALTKGQAKLERAAEVCGQMNWSQPEEAIRHARSMAFGGVYDDLPLCEIEEAMAVKKHNSLSVLIAYEVVAPVIAKQLGGLMRARGEAARAEPDRAA